MFSQQTVRFVYIVLDKINMQVVSRHTMERVRAITKLFPNAPKRIKCKICEGMMPNAFLKEGYLRTICGYCLNKHPARKARKKARKTRSDKGTKRKRT